MTWKFNYGDEGNACAADVLDSVMTDEGEIFHIQVDFTTADYITGFSSWSKSINVTLFNVAFRGRTTGEIQAYQEMSFMNRPNSVVSDVRCRSTFNASNLQVVPQVCCVLWATVSIWYRLVAENGYAIIALSSRADHPVCAGRSEGSDIYPIGRHGQHAVCDGMTTENCSAAVNV